MSSDKYLCFEQSRRDQERVTAKVKLRNAKSLSRQNVMAGMGADLFFNEPTRLVDCTMKTTVVSKLKKKMAETENDPLNQKQSWQVSLGVGGIDC